MFLSCFDCWGQSFFTTHATMTKRPIEEFTFSCVQLVYVMKLEDDCWYVGKTSNLNARIAEHFGLNGRFHGAQWTQKHHPISIQEVVVGDWDTENEITEKYIGMYGLDKVRGGKYLDRSGNPPKIKKPKEPCPVCGSKTHKTRKWCMKRFLIAFEIELKPMTIYNLDE